MMEVLNVASSPDPKSGATPEQDSAPDSPASENAISEEELLRYTGESVCARRPAIDNESLEEYLARTKRKPEP